jgi:hypothetical protein
MEYWSVGRGEPSTPLLQYSKERLQLVVKCQEQLDDEGRYGFYALQS